MLDDRKSAILRAVVERYIETAQPVGSTHVVESTSVGVSSATVRNEMTMLETEGYLAQPHTSAGRIPTEKGYRFFVDTLGGPGELGPAQIREVRTFFSHAHGELEAMLRAVILEDGLAIVCLANAAKRWPNVTRILVETGFQKIHVNADYEVWKRSSTL